VLAIFMLITQEGLAAGSVVWGAIGSRAGVDAALIWAGIATVAITALGVVAKLPDDVADVSPWNHWRMPAIVQSAEPGLDDGPVLVTVEYPRGADPRPRISGRDGTIWTREAAGRRVPLGHLP
jgi:hypothetical protein